MMQASIYGRLGADPVSRTTRDGKPMVTASVGVTVSRPDAPDDTCWFSVAAFGRVGDDVARHRKGDLVGVMGAVTRRRYTSRDGHEREGWQLLADAVMSASTVRPNGRTHTIEDPFI